MLALTRKLDQSIVIDGDIIVTVVAIEGGAVRLGIQAPKGKTIDRLEVHEAKQAARKAAP